MARVNIGLVLLAALAAVLLSPPVIATHTHHLRRRTTGGCSKIMSIGHTADLMQQHEGRRACAYNHKGGFRAVGSGYNLDQDRDQRRSELRAAGLDYDRVYKGDQCLEDLQISGLLMLDAERSS
ncbi:hypothetical protein R1flu_017251 [Riccia fluitans]|uniref:Secreted protein n=1 Tax=Riccia fluitans TaxID=41844 RepID=A0ABD1XGZ1_9MARC